MLGVVLAAISQLFAEIGTSIGKYEVAHKKESLYAFGFLNAFWATAFLAIIMLFRGEFVFSLASLPTFGLRVVLEIILMFVSAHAVITADRSTFAFLRVLTIPLLLGIDIMLGYAISHAQILGMTVIFIACVLLFSARGLSRRGRLLSIGSAILAAATLSLYKYNIENYNSVEAEQTLLHLITLSVFVVAAWWHGGENVFRLLVRRDFLAQSVVAGIAGVLFSYAFLFAPASVITTSKRVFEILGSIVSGRAVFHEKHIVVKLIACALITLGLYLMVR